MADIVVKRCPVCPSIGGHAREMAATPDYGLGVGAHIEDGAEGEFSVLADGVPLLQRGGESLPSVEEVEAAVRNAAPAPTGV